MVQTHPGKCPACVVAATEALKLAEDAVMETVLEGMRFDIQQGRRPLETAQTRAALKWHLERAREGEKRRVGSEAAGKAEGERMEREAAVAVVLGGVKGGGGTALRWARRVWGSFVGFLKRTPPEVSLEERRRMDIEEAEAWAAWVEQE
jgi:hypothetical protein